MNISVTFLLVLAAVLALVVFVVIAAVMQGGAKRAEQRIPVRVDKPRDRRRR